MNRLAATYRVEIPTPTMAAYWTVFGASDDQRFIRACERAMETERTFPPPAALKAVMRDGAEIVRRTESGSGSTPSRHWTAEDFDVPFVATPTLWPPGSRGHERWLHASARLTTLLERRLTERLEELDRNPGDADLDRRVQVLVRTLGERSTWHAHFEQTGESLIPRGAP
jgi:hypothetical protein